MMLVVCPFRVAGGAVVGARGAQLCGAGLRGAARRGAAGAALVGARAPQRCAGGRLQRAQGQARPAARDQG